MMMGWQMQQGGGKAFGGKGKGKGAWGKDAWGGQQQQQQWGIPGLQDALHQAVSTVADSDPELGEILKKMQQKINKLADKYAKDERISHKGTASQAKVLVEEFVESIMNQISGCCYEKPWFLQVNFTNPLLLIVLHILSASKIFARTLKPQLIKYIEDGFFKWQEEERVTKAIFDVIELSGIPENMRKKANQHLMKAYDDAHMKAPFGSTTNESPELAVLQDFVKGWMAEFVGRAAWDVLDGLTDNSKESQVSQVTVLFQNLLDPSVAVIPADIATEVMSSSVGALPASPWNFIDVTASEVFAELEAMNQPGMKKRKKGEGKF